MNLLRKFAKYGTVALGSAVTDWIVFTALVIPGLTSPLIGQMISRIAGGVFSFSVNKFWSFKSKEGKHLVKEGRRFLLLYGFSYCLSISVFFVLTEVAGVPAFIAKLATDSAILIINFFVMNHYVFHVRAGFSQFFLRRPKKAPIELD